MSEIAMTSIEFQFVVAEVGVGCTDSTSWGIFFFFGVIFKEVAQVEDFVFTTIALEDLIPGLDVINDALGWFFSDVDALHRHGQEGLGFSSSDFFQS